MGLAVRSSMGEKNGKRRDNSSDAVRDRLAAVNELSSDQDDRAAASRAATAANGVSADPPESQ